MSADACQKERVVWVMTPHRLALPSSQMSGTDDGEESRTGLESDESKRFMATDLL